jgi:hypothetical protein
MANKHIYKIIITSHNKQIEYVGSYVLAKSANKKFNEIVKQSESVKFPVLNIIKKRKITPAKYNVIILKRRLDENEDNVTLLRNEYGSYVEHETTSDEWVVYYKATLYREETFWVYGFNPFTQRKNFEYIYDKLVKPYCGKKDSILNIYVYKNKVVFDSVFHTDLVTCKCKDDAIRLHNMIQTYAVKNKLKYILFSGDWSYGENGKSAIAKIQELTNWNLDKIKRYTTRP